jgi:hypothetical protein
MSVLCWDMGKILTHATQQAGISASTVSTLLRSLQMNTAPASAQKVALHAWLSEHPPGPELRVSLRRNGFGMLLGRVQGSDTPR